MQHKANHATYTDSPNLSLYVQYTHCHHRTKKLKLTSSLQKPGQSRTPAPQQHQPPPKQHQYAPQQQYHQQQQPHQQQPHQQQPRYDKPLPTQRDARSHSLGQAAYGHMSPPPNTSGARPQAHNRPVAQSRPPPSPALDGNGSDPSLLPLFRAVDKDGKFFCYAHFRRRAKCTLATYIAVH